MLLAACFLDLLVRLLENILPQMVVQNRIMNPTVESVRNHYLDVHGSDRNDR